MRAVLFTEVFSRHMAREEAQVKANTPVYCMLLAVLSMASMTVQATDSLKSEVAVVSDYVFRGISQSNNKAALQGGAEYQHSLGFYAGVWGSTVDTGPFNAPDDGSFIEVDLYSGFSSEIKAIDLGWDVGVISYQYNDSDDTYNEVYGSVSFDPWRDHLTVVGKVSYDWDNNVTTAEARATLSLGRDIHLNFHPGQVRFDETAAEDYYFAEIGVGTRFDISRYIKTLDVDINYSDTDLDQDIDGNSGLAHRIWWLALKAHF